MTMLENTLQQILDEMHKILSHAVEPNNRHEYLRGMGIRHDINKSFSFTPTDIIRDKIPSNVIGCTGRAKLFCHLAQQHGISCNVVAMATLAAGSGGQVDQ